MFYADTLITPEERCCPTWAGETWKLDRPYLRWICCEHCSSRFDGPGSDSEPQAILAALLGGWRIQTPTKLVDDQFLSLEEVLEGLEFCGEMVCPRCYRLEFQK